MTIDLGVPRNAYVEPVTEETALISEGGEWSWLADGLWSLDRGFPDTDGGEYRDGYFKAPMTNAPQEYAPERVCRVRCNWGAADLWDQEPDPEFDYIPPKSTYRGEPVVSIQPAFSADGDNWWIIETTPTREETVSEVEQHERVEITGCQTTFFSDADYRTEGYLELEVYFEGEDMPTPDEVADAWRRHMDELGLTDD